MESKLPSTVFKKGEKRPGQGKRGPNKMTVDLKNMILEALNNSGGAEYLEARANDPRTAAAFLGLVGKVLPMTVQGPGPDGSHKSVIRVEFVNPAS